MFNYLLNELYFWIKTYKTTYILKLILQIKFITPYEYNDENITYIITQEYDLRKLFDNRFELNLYQWFREIMNKIPKLCLNTLAKPDIQKLFEEKYDLIFLAASSNECFLSMVYQMQVSILNIVYLLKILRIDLTKNEFCLILTCINKNNFA